MAVHYWSVVYLFLLQERKIILNNYKRNWDDGKQELFCFNLLYFMISSKNGVQF